MISILLPSRGRPGNVRRLVQSLADMTAHNWEVLIRLDNDDGSEYDPTLPYPNLPYTRYFTGPRTLLSQCWNELVPYAEGDIFMHAGDDITFNTYGWDETVRDAFPPDEIAFVYGNDLSPNASSLGTHGFISRKAAEAVGYFMPPYFSSDYNDLWWNEVYRALGRTVYLPNVITEHHHPAFGKGEWDLTHQERVERHKADDVDRIWAETADKRLEDIEKLRKVMDE